MKPIIIVSSDAHAGVPLDGYIHFMEWRYRGALDELVLAEREAHQRMAMAGFGPFPKEALEVVDGREAIRSGGASGVYDPLRRLREVEAEGIVAEILHPNGDTSPFFSPTSKAYSGELRAVGTRAYNRWLAQYCQAAPGRLIGMACVEPWPDLEAAARQVREARRMGLGGVLPPFFVGHEAGQPPFYDQAWDPFWKACCDEAMPISLHAAFATGPQGTYVKIFTDLAQVLANAKGADGTHVHSQIAGAMDKAFSVFWPTRRPLWQLMWSGVLDRFPELKVVFTEIHACWLPAVLDHLEERFAAGNTGLKKSPREYWQRNFAVSGSSIRPAEMTLRHRIGVGNLMFGTDYPHHEGTWPNTLDWIRATFREVPEKETRRMLGENAIAFYGLDRKLLAREAKRVGPTMESLFGGNRTIDPRMIDHFDQRSGYKKEFVPAPVDEGELRALVDEDERAIAA